MSVIKNFATAIGDAVGSFERAREVAKTPARKARPKVGQISRPQWIADMALEGRWSHGDYYADEEEAQRRALVNGWWFSAIAEIAGEVSGAGLNVVTQSETDDEPEIIKNHPFVQLLRKPNPWMSRAFLWAYTVQWMKMDGNAYWFLAADRNRELREIWPLPANDVEPWPSEDPQKFIDYYIYRVYGKEYHIPSEYVCHIQNYPNPFNIFDGLSELAAALLPVDADLAMARWNAKFFDDDNVMPSAVINLKSGNPEYEIDAASVESMRHDLTENYQANERKTFVTWAPGGIDVQMLGWSMRDMEFQGGRQMTRQEIFEICGIPEGRTAKNATEANAKVGDRIFKSNVYNRSLVPMQEQITARIIIPYYGAEYRAEFNDIRPADREMQMQELEKGKGALTVNEVRTKYYNLPGLEDERGQAIYSGQEPIISSPTQVPPSQDNIDGTATETAADPQAEQESQVNYETQQELDKQQAQKEQSTPAKALPVHDGAMVAFFPSEEKRNEFFNAIPDSVFPEGSERLPADELHLTLAYMGSTSEGAVFEDIYNAVVRFAEYWAPLEGEINGTGRFAANKEQNTSAFYASFDSPELPEFRQALINRLADFGVEIKRDHGYTPHMTLAYIPGDAPTPSFEPPKIQLVFENLTIAWGDLRFEVKLSGSRKALSLDAKEEIRRWKDKVTRSVKRGKGIPDFECEHLPDAAIEIIEKRLKTAESLGEVKSAFEFETQDGVVAIDLSGEVYKATMIPVGAGMPLPQIPDAITFTDADADMMIWNEILPDYPSLLSADHINSDVTDVVLFGIPERSPWIWNGSTRIYAGLDGTLVEGKKVELDDMIRLRDEIMTALVQLSDGLAQSLVGGDLSVQEWLLRLRALVKKAYLIEFVLARGGLRSLSRDDLGKLSTMIETQFRYMDILGMNIRDGKLTKAEIREQSATFVESAIQAF